MTGLPPCPAPFNLAAHVLAAGAARPDKIALQILRPNGAERWSYARLIAAVRGAGAGLLARGLEPGERVLLRLGNGPGLVVAYLAAIAVGLIPVPSAAALTGPEITRMAARIGPALVIADPGIALPAGEVPVLSGGALLAMERLAPAPFAMGDPERPAYILFTSGTSGQPQAVVHAHRAIWARAMMHRGWEGLGETDRLMHLGAMNWSYTLGTGLLDPWTLGATALDPAAGVEVGQLALLARRFDATILAAVPGVFRQMLKRGLPALPRLRHGLTAGEPLPPALRQAWREACGTDLHEAFGMTEVSTFLSGAPDRPAPPGMAGYAQAGRRLAVLGADGPLPPGQPGILAVHRSDPGLMLGYWRDPRATAARFRGDWFVTGDLVEQAPDGAFRALGRADELMNPGGYRVAPLEVESALAGLGLREAAVAEIEVQPGTRVIGCFYVAETDLDPEAARTSLVRQLAPWKLPRLWFRLDALPRNANNKLDRKALARLAALQAATLPAPPAAPKEGA